MNRTFKLLSIVDEPNKLTNATGVQSFRDEGLRRSHIHLEVWGINPFIKLNVAEPINLYINVNDVEARRKYVTEGTYLVTGFDENMDFDYPEPRRIYDLESIGRVQGFRRDAIYFPSMILLPVLK